MDFIAAPSQAEHVLVPYLGGRYDDGWFGSYGSRAGWNPASLRRGDVAGARVDYDEASAHYVPLEQLRQQAARFVQTWLFFGLLTESLNGPEIKRSTFTRTVLSADGAPLNVLTTEALPNMIKMWHAGMMRAPLELRKAQLGNCMDIIDRSCSFLADTRQSELKRPPFIPPEQHLCLSGLAAFLNHWVMKLNEEFTALFAFNMANFPLKKHLLQEGYCPNFIERTERSLSVLGVYYLSLLKTGRDAKRHRNCSLQSCEANTVDESSYKVAHWAPNCESETDIPSCSRCKIIRVRMSVQMHRFLNRGNIPVLDFSADFEAGRSHKRRFIVGADKSTRFAAVSHVWADGLGNPEDNALPICQLKRLRQQLRTVLTSHQFNMLPLLWIDTLCVPIKPETSRKEAILAMRDIYKLAEFVWVLDGTLMHLPVPSSVEQTLFQIVSCPWMTRLWTFQEAWLAKCLVFQFADGTVELGDLLERASRPAMRKFDGGNFISGRTTRMLRDLWVSTRPTIDEAMRWWEGTQKQPSRFPQPWEILLAPHEP